MNLGGFYSVIFENSFTWICEGFVMMICVDLLLYMWICEVSVLWI